MLCYDEGDLQEEQLIEVNGKKYRLDTPPIVGICVDGTDPSYLAAANGLMPNLTRMAAQGASGILQSVVPSYTNPNNIAIATGVTSDVNGICGNFYYDQDTGKEVMMNDPHYLRCNTLFAAFAQAGREVAVITAKEKLRRLLGNNLKGICFSVECAMEATVKEHGIENVAQLVGASAPGIYDPEASIYCLQAGAVLLEKNLADFLYLSTTDFVQHKYPPGSSVANNFYGSLDKVLGRLDATGAIIALTADHGMNQKTLEDGSPRVQFLEILLAEAGFPKASVLLPITDPYVIHHGALGSYATVYMLNGDAPRAAQVLRSVPGVDLVLTREEAVARFHLPPDRIGDLVVLGDEHTTFGRTPEWHDLSAVKTGLRSHGGLHERNVPFVINRPLASEYAGRLASGQGNNYELFDFALNGVRS
jgi:phosphonoacetate hydrolase